MLKFLNKRYPYLRTHKKSIITNFFIGTFIAFFLIVFKPFQIDLWVTEHKTLKLIIFGSISFIVPTAISFLIEWIVPRKILEDSWKIWHEMVSVILILCGIALGNLIYGDQLHIMHFSFKGYLTALLVVVTVGVFPITFYILSSQNKMLKANLRNAELMNSQIETFQKGTEVKNEHVSNDNLIFVSENEKEKLIIKPAQLLYIESADNYSTIVFTENGIQKKTLIRSSLKRLESQLNSSFVMRCHRAFIINLKNVKHIDGNAAGYKAHFLDSENTIPVSRAYGNLVMERLKALN